MSKIPGFRSNTKWKKVVASIGYIFIALFVIGAVFGNNGNSTPTSTASATPPAPQAKTSTPKATTTAATTATSDASSNQTADSTPAADNSSNSSSRLTWNTSELDTMKNGNMAIAIETMQNGGNIQQSAAAPTPGDVFKRPWDYYGKPIKLSGQVAIVQDYPPGSDLSQMLGGQASEIVLLCDDGTPVDFVLKGDSGNIQVGDRVTVYGYDTGTVDVKNKLGGNTTELFAVGNTATAQ